MDCIFCKLAEAGEKIFENELAYVIQDKFPVSDGHCLMIPKRHFTDFFGSTSEEREAIGELVDKAKAMLDKKFRPDGYNIVMNCGAAAGQTVFHMHVHLIPRYNGKAVKVLH